MVATTPFHARLSELNTTGLYGHWSGFLSALRYDVSAKFEYFCIRNSAGVFDTSPLFKYWIRGRDAERFLSGVMTRDIRLCRPGRAQYTVWCDDGGYVLKTAWCSATRRPSSSSPAPSRTWATSPT